LIIVMVGGHTAVVQTTSSFTTSYNNAPSLTTTVVTIDNNGTLDSTASMKASFDCLRGGRGGGIGTRHIGLGDAGFPQRRRQQYQHTFNAPSPATAPASSPSLGTGAMDAHLREYYTGSTNVNAGALLVNNTTGSATGTSTVAINTGGTLGGSGTVSGGITLNSGGSSSRARWPRASPWGTLSVPP